MRMIAGENANRVFEYTRAAFIIDIFDEMREVLVYSFLSSFSCVNLLLKSASPMGVV